MATRHFSPDTSLGKGRLGSFFKGWLDEQSLATAKPRACTIIAVKKLNKETLHDHQKWLAEVNHLGEVNHPNLVTLYGYCLEDNHRLLVYEYVPRGNLGHHLFTNNVDIHPLSWLQRKHIALDAASGLAYLHRLEAKVICRDFKSSSILIDYNYHAKLSCFGFPNDVNQLFSTQVMGTYGYTAPEYVFAGQLTSKSDIYSFGVVLLEIMTGRPCIDKNRPPIEQMLIKFAKPYLTNEQGIMQIMDQHIDGEYTLTQAKRAAKLVIQCLSEEPKHRPTADEVVKALEQLIDCRGKERRFTREQTLIDNYTKIVSYPSPVVLLDSASTSSGFQNPMDLMN